jgi:hypothetical protein
LEGAAVSFSVFVPARKVFPDFRRGTVINLDDGNRRN